MRPETAGDGDWARELARASPQRRFAMDEPDGWCYEERRGACGAAFERQLRNHGMSGALFTDLISSITERGRRLLGRPAVAAADGNDAAALVELCEQLLSRRGEASGTALASEVLQRYERLDSAGKLALFEALATRFGPDRDRLDALIEAWRSEPSDETAGDVHFYSEPRRQELFRRLNRAPGGTTGLVGMRADLLGLLRDHPQLATVDRDFAHLLGSWFNRGFLVLRRIDWSTPAIVLEKIIRYEAVHEIHDFHDLRRRIDPTDRRCYGFFHPALIDEPLIFVEVALTETIPDAIAPLLSEERRTVPLSQARTAAFYSISNCQKGLAGISFGNFLIKQVVEELRRELPKLDTFVTLSPVPGFMRWLDKNAEGVLSEDELRTVHDVAQGAAIDADASEKLRRVLEPAAAAYFLKAKRADGRPIDSVARFHLGNGARLERINWFGDRSAKGLRDSVGLMVNYLYDLDHIEENHEIYANHAEIVASNAVRKLLRGEPRPAAPLLKSLGVARSGA
jgi:malonyl-CoA decarboxylase